MPKSRNTPAAIPPITDFESCQKARSLILRRFADILGVWEDCANKACGRARSCQGEDTACLRASMQAIPDEDRRELRYALDNRAAGLSPREAMEQAQARIAGEIARDRETEGPALTEPCAGSPLPPRSRLLPTSTLSYQRPRDRPMPVCRPCEGRERRSDPGGPGERFSPVPDDDGPTGPAPRDKIAPDSREYRKSRYLT